MGEGFGVPTVLVVDNEQGLLTLFSSMVRRLGYYPLQANGGEAALNILDQETPSLLVLDMAMPGISGVEVLRYLMGIPRLDVMPVIVVTALGPGPAPHDVADRIAYWLTKPVHPETFMSLVRSLVEGEN
jgi:CheY-like chemotaxis protein